MDELVNSDFGQAQNGYTPIGNISNFDAIKELADDSFDAKGYADALEKASSNAYSTALNNVALMSNSAIIKSDFGSNQNQYSMPNTDLTQTIGNFVSAGESASVQNYLKGFDIFLDNMKDTFATASDLVNLEFKAQEFDANQELAWANQELARLQFNEDSRHTTVMNEIKKEKALKAQEERRQAEAEEAEAKANLEQAYKDAYNALVGGSSEYTGSSNDSLLGNMFGDWNISTSENSNTAIANTANDEDEKLTFWDGMVDGISQWDDIIFPWRWFD